MYCLTRDRFLRPNIVLTIAILESVPAHLPRDMEIFPVNDIIAGSLDVLLMKSGHWNIPSYSNLQKDFDNCKSKWVVQKVSNIFF